MKKVFLFLSFILFTFLSSAQSGKNLVREGNKKYEEGNYSEAQEKYLQSLKLNSENYKAQFNLADALYRQKKYPEAAAKFSQIAKLATDKNKQAKAYHNLGNSLYSSEEYGKSVQAYKNALRLNPNDDNTRYNLMRALEKLQQQNNKDEQNKDDKQDQKEKQEDEQKKDEKEENKDENKEGENKDDKEKEGDEDKKDEPKPEEGQQQKQEKPNQLSPQAAERMLDALNQEEQKIQAKLKKKKESGKARVIEKDW